MLLINVNDNKIEMPWSSCVYFSDKSNGNVDSQVNFSIAK